MIIKITYEPETLVDAVRFLDEFCAIEYIGTATCEIGGGFTSQPLDDEEE